MYKRKCIKTFISFLIVLLFVGSSLIYPIGTYSQNIENIILEDVDSSEIIEELDKTIELIKSPLKQIAYNGGNASEIHTILDNSVNNNLPTDQTGLVSQNANMTDDLYNQINYLGAVLPNISEYNESVKPEFSQLPSILTNIKATSSIDEITLVFEAVYGATGYDIEADGIVVDLGDSTTYTHSDLEQNSEHVYRVRANNSFGSSEWSELIKASTKEIIIGIPEKLTAKTSGNFITIAWDSVANATGYDIEVNGKIVSNLNSTSYIHEGVLENTNYSYRVRAKNSQITGEWSNEIRIVNTSNHELNIPGKLKAMASTNEIKLVWEEVYDAISYEIEVDGVIVGNCTDTSYIDCNLISGTYHTYRVRSVNLDSLSEWSTSITTCILLEIPKVEVKCITSESVTLVWSDVPEATGYEIEIDGNIIEINKVLEFKHEGIQPGVKYKYRVRAKKNLGANNEVNSKKIQEIKYNETLLGDWSTVYTLTPVDSSSQIDGEWISKVNMPVASYLHGAAEMNGKIYTIGGYISNAPSNRVDEYNPITDTWIAKANMSTARYQMGVIEVGNKIYSIGGRNATSALNKVEEYDPATNTWTTKANMPIAKYGFGIAEYEGKIFLFGGQYSGGVLNTVEEYDPITNTFYTLPSMGSIRSSMGTTEMDGKVFILGGYNGSSAINKNDVLNLLLPSPPSVPISINTSV